MITLMDLTGQESGIVVYDNGSSSPEAIICNWSSIDGLPRLLGVMPNGMLLGLGEFRLELIGGVAFDKIPCRVVDNIGKELEGVDIIYDINEDTESLKESHGWVWEFPHPSGDGTVRVYAPDGWA